MRKHPYISFIVIFFSLLGGQLFAQAEKNELSVSLAYYNSNNQMHYLKAQAKSKINGKLQMIPGIELAFYITDETAPNLLGKSVTNAKGEAVLPIPASAKDEWNKSAAQHFSAVSVTNKQFETTTGSVDIVKAKIQIDTLEDRNIVATLFELKDSIWAPVKEVDLRVAIKRQVGELNVNETPTYTTDSLGMVTAEFKRENFPGDSKGNLVLIAKLDENDVYGNLTAEKIVPWGIIENHPSVFDHRTLFARRGYSPLWLEVLAYSIVVIVWVVLFYLVLQIRKIKQLGV